MQPLKHAVESAVEKVATAIQPGGEIAGEVRVRACWSMLEHADHSKAMPQVHVLPPKPSDDPSQTTPANNVNTDDSKTQQQDDKLPPRL